MLTQMLEEGVSLKNLPKPERFKFITLASYFQKSYETLFFDPEELATITQVGTPDQWKALLSLPETIAYIKGNMAFLAQIAQRKTFNSLVQQALQGNQQAAKQVQELSGIMNQQDSNRTIILHHIPRPKEETK